MIRGRIMMVILVSETTCFRGLLVNTLCIRTGVEVVLLWIGRKLKPIAFTSAPCSSSVIQATAGRPFFATSVNSFNEAPPGRFSSRSHWLTKLVVTLRRRAKTA